MLLPSAIGLAGSVGGMVAAGIQRRKSEKLINNARANAQADIDENKRQFDVDYNQDFFDTNVASSAMREMNESAEEANKAAANDMIRGGGTSNASIAARAQIEDSKQDAMTNLASQGTAYKQGLKSNYQSQANALKNRLGAYDSAKMDIYDARAKSWENFGSNAGDMIGQGLGDIDLGGK